MRDLNLIQTFTVFSNALNIHAAAQKLRCSQSTITLHLQRLEAEFGTALFAMRGKKKTLTPAGKQLLQAVSPRLDELVSCLDITQSKIANPRRMRLRIGGRRETLARYASKLQFEGVLEFKFLPTLEAQAKFLAHELDLIVVHDRRTLAHRIFTRKLFSDGYSLLVHENLLSQNKIGRVELNRELLLNLPALVYGQADAQLLATCQNLGINPQEIMLGAQIEDWSVLVDLVEKERGYCIAPNSFAPKSSAIRRISIPTTIIPQLTFYLAYRDDVRKLFKDKRLTAS